MTSSTSQLGRELVTLALPGSQSALGVASLQKPLRCWQQGLAVRDHKGAENLGRAMLPG